MALWGFEGWVGDFYPPGSKKSEFLELYVERMNAVEGNTFFYGVPTEERVEKWAEKMPSRFRICPKLHRDITHRGPLVPNKEEAAAFIQPMKAFDENLGAFHLQLPPSYGPDMHGDLERFLEAWPREKAPIAVEVRHTGWFDSPNDERLRATLEDLGVARVLLDTRPIYDFDDDAQAHSDRQKPKVPMDPHRTCDLTFVRYISHPDIPRNDDYLERWAARIDDWLRDETDVYFFVHCPYERFSPTIARRFQALLEDRNAPVPPLPWNELPASPQQPDLL